MGSFRSAIAWAMVASVVWLMGFVFLISFVLPGDAQTAIGLVLAPVYAAFVGYCVFFIRYGIQAAQGQAGWQRRFCVGVAVLACLFIIVLNGWLVVESFF